MQAGMGYNPTVLDIRKESKKFISPQMSYEVILLFEDCQCVVEFFNLSVTVVNVLLI